MSFSPNIVGFACQWCTYAGADLAGNLRCKYPPSIKLIKVPCSGRVEPSFVYEALSRGADGVFVGGCHFGDCHYKDGNYKTDRRMKTVRELLNLFGFEPGRFRWDWISGAEGRKFAEVMTEYTEELQQLGPNPLNRKVEAPSSEDVRVTVNGKELVVMSVTTLGQLFEAQGISCARPGPSAKLEHICNAECPAFNALDVDGRLVPAKLAMKMRVKDGMRIQTESALVTQALAGRLDWLEKHGNCTMIQQIQEFVACEAANSGFIDPAKRGSDKADAWKSDPSILHDPALCVRCGNCVKTCNEVQEVGALAMDEEKGVVMVDEGRCTRCGQCIHACPVAKETFEAAIFKTMYGCGPCAFGSPRGAITEQDHVAEVIAALDDPNITVVVQVAPSIRVSIGEEFSLPSGELAIERLYTALKTVGFDKVWDTNFAADLTIMEEGSELLLRLAKAGVLQRESLPVQVKDEIYEHVEAMLPQFTSCSPGWVKFCETFYPDLLGHMSSAKSPQQMFGAVAKTYAAGDMGVKAENLMVVSIMPCTAKKYECARDEMQDAARLGKKDRYRDVDLVLTTREAARLLKAKGIDLAAMARGEADPLVGQYTGAGTIFGRTGGVMEAALRTAYELITGKGLPKLEFESLGTLDGVKKATVDVAGIPVKVAVAHGLKNCREVCESIRTGGEFKDYQFIEFMCCPGGCIGGGGQPIATDLRTVKARTAGLNTEDKNSALRKSHENPEIAVIYKEFLGSYLSPLAHELLHTRYTDRSGEMQKPES